MLKLFRISFAALLIIGVTAAVSAQADREARDHGSLIAKAGFKNEDEIRDKFNKWETDTDARAWLTAMNYRIDEVATVAAGKPHGQKADVEVIVRLKNGVVKREGISIKLVSSPNGFNQIDKRWLRQYARMWSMPKDVESGLSLFVGETAPLRPSRDPKRMYLNELAVETQNAILEFFSKNKEMIISDLLEGDGLHSAGWLMVAYKATNNTRWSLKRSTEVARYFAEGKVEITRAGNLKIGKITMQRKGGDGGRETAKMLQFKMNPVQMFEMK